jgi:DNA-binding transcriptional LysR family regulator
VNLRFVEAFYWVASLQSVTRAAQKMCLTQSAMSSRISALEDELGVLLLDRRDKQFRLTLAGARFYEYAQRFLELQGEMKSVMGAEAKLTRSLRIGVIESVLHSWLIPWLEHLRDAHPTLALELSVDTTPTLVEQVNRGTQDLVFAALPATGEAVSTRTLPSMSMAFIGNKTVHKRRRYTLQDLAQMEILTFQRGSQPHVSLVDQFARAEVTPKRIHTISSISAMAQLIQGGFGVATLPLEAVNNRLSFPTLRALLCDTRLEPLPIHASYREDPSSKAVQTLLDSATAFIGGRP